MQKQQNQQFRFLFVSSSCVSYGTRALVGEPWSQSCLIYLTASDLQVGQPSDLAKNCMA